MSQNQNFSAEFSKTYNSFSGCDIHAVFGGNVVLEIQGLSFTVSREKAPIYTMGNPNPRSFSRGKRGIAGSLIFTVFDRQALLEVLRDGTAFWADKEEVTATKQRRSDGKIVSPRAGNESSQDIDVLGSYAPAHAWYEDQIPPFTIVLVAMNEYGHQMEMQIRGCEILNVGQGISIDDLMIDQQMTFIATDIIPWWAKKHKVADPKAAAHPVAVGAAAQRGNKNTVLSILGSGAAGRS